MSTPNPLLAIYKMITGVRQPIVPNAPTETPPTLPANIAAPPTILEAGGRQVVRQPHPQRYFQQHGIMPQQEARHPGLSEALYETVQPAFYGLYNNPRGEAGTAIDYGPKENRISRFIDVIRGRAEPRAQVSPFEEASWKLYLGVPLSNKQVGGGEEGYALRFASLNSREPVRERDLIQVSDYKPSEARNSRQTYYAVPERLINTDKLQEWVRTAAAAKAHGQDRIVVDAGPGLPFQNFTLSVGSDNKGTYVSYYDIYDLDIPDERSGRVGKPFEFYDRIYFDPKTGIPLSRRNEILRDEHGRLENDYPPIKHIRDQFERDQIGENRYFDTFNRLKGSQEFREWTQQRLEEEFSQIAPALSRGSRGRR